MGLPRKLKNMNLFVDGGSYIGEAEEVVLPKLSRKTEAYRGGGMAGAVHVDMGLDDDALKAEWTIGGYKMEILKQMKAVAADGVQLRFAGAFQRDDTGEVTAVEVVMRGRHQEVDRGTYKVGDNSTTKVSTNCVYYKETVNGAVVTEIDVLNMIHIVDGEDLLKAQRKALGL